MERKPRKQRERREFKSEPAVSQVGAAVRQLAVAADSSYWKVSRNISRMKPQAKQ